jgi:signal transduction histidine kinase
MLHSSSLPKNLPNIISEFNILINVVNQYNNQQVCQRLNKIVARVVHDIKSPLSVIEFSIAELLDNNHPKRLIIKNALRNRKL